MTNQHIDAFLDELYEIEMSKEAAWKLPHPKIVRRSVDRVRDAARKAGDRTNRAVLSAYLSLPSKAQTAVNHALSDPDLPRTIANYFNK